MDEHIGKLAYKRLGYFSGLTGKIEKSNSEITPYKLVFKSAGAVGFRSLDDIVLIEEEQMK